MRRLSLAVVVARAIYKTTRRSLSRSLPYHHRSPTRATPAPYTAGGAYYCMGSSSVDDYSPAREIIMCMEIGGRGRRGGRTAADGGKTTTNKQKQPQRGLGVAQLEKIRLHNQMVAAYRSAAAAQQLHDDDAASTTAMMMHHLVPPPPAGAGGGSSFQPYHHLTNRCFEETTDHRQGVVPYYDGLQLPYSRAATSPPAPTPSLYAHGVRDSSGHRLGQPPPQQQHYWMMSSRSDGAASAEELDLELRL